MIRIAALVMFAGLGFPRLTGAATLDDLFARGYTVAASTRLAGSFTGCIRQHRLVFADGTVFACAHTTAQTGYEPRAYILSLGGQPPSVVLVGSRVQAGQLLRLRLHEYPVPLRVNADPLQAGPATLGASLPPIGPIPSIDTLARQQNASLSEQQARLPTRPFGNRTNR